MERVECTGECSRSNHSALAPFLDSAMQFQSRGQQRTITQNQQHKPEEKEQNKNKNANSKQNRAESKEKNLAPRHLHCAQRPRRTRAEDESNLLLRIFIVAHTCARCAL